MAESTAQTMWPWPDYKSIDKYEAASIKRKYGPMLRYDPAEAEKIFDDLGYKKNSSIQLMLFYHLLEVLEINDFK